MMIVIGDTNHCVFFGFCQDNVAVYLAKGKVNIGIL